MRVVVVVVAVAAAAGFAGGCNVDPAHLPDMTFDLKPDDEWPVTELAPAPGPGEGRIYVTDNLDDTISIVDLDSAEAGQPTLLAKVPVGFVPVEREGPHHCTADADGEFYYFGISNFVPGSGSGPHGVHGAGTIDGHMVKMRVDDNTFVAASRVDPNPGDVRLTPDGTTLLSSHFDLAKIAKAEAAGITSGPDFDSRLAIIDPKTMALPKFIETCPAAHGIAITADSKTAVTSCVDDQIAIVDIDAAKNGAAPADAVTLVPILDERGTADTPLCQPYAITMDGDTAWVSCFSSGQVIGVDVPTKTRNGKQLQLPGIAVFGEIRDGILLIAHQGADGISMFDVSGAQPALLASVFTTPDDCIAPHVAHFNDDGSKIFAVCEGNRSEPGTFIVVDAVAPEHTILGKTELGIYPDDIAVMRRAP